jgi:hypothetical protein
MGKKGGKGKGDNKNPEQAMYLTAEGRQQLKENGVKKLRVSTNRIHRLTDRRNNKNRKEKRQN